MVISVQEVKRKFSIWEYKCFVHDQFLTDFLRNGPLFIVHLKKKKIRGKNWSCFLLSTSKGVMKCDGLLKLGRCPSFPYFWNYYSIGFGRSTMLWNSRTFYDTERHVESTAKVNAYFLMRIIYLFFFFLNKLADSLANFFHIFLFLITLKKFKVKERISARLSCLLFKLSYVSWC